LTGKLARRYGDFAGRRVRGEITLPLEDAVAYHRALDAGEVTTARQAAIGRQQALLDANLKLQEGIESGYKTVASERLTQIDAAADALASGGKPKLGVVGELAKGGVFGGALAVGSALTGSPWLGAVLAGKVADLAEDVLLRRLAGKLSQGAAAHSERLGAAVERFAKVAERGAQAAPLAATKVLGSVSYASPAAVVATPARAQAVATNERVKVYREREHELLSQVAAGPDGRPTMTPAARRELHGRLAGVAAVSPGLADKLESVAARRIEFLASRLPKRPDAGLAVGPDRWQPSSMDVARFARYVAAVEDPAGVVERLGDGTLTPEDAEALREVYPETFAAVQAQLLDTLPTLRESLPYERRVSLSILLGVPVDPAMQPGVLRILQGNYAAEPGTGGGTAPPRPQLPHGTPKSPEKPTAAQERAG
jgi:hypothetical protein